MGLIKEELSALKNANQNLIDDDAARSAELAKKAEECQVQSMPERVNYLVVHSSRKFTISDVFLPVRNL